MKKLIFSFVIFSFLLLVGCQDSSITDPVSTQPTQKAQHPYGVTTTGTIHLSGVLLAPGQLNTYYTVKGTIKYTHQLFPSPPVPALERDYVGVTLAIDASLTGDAIQGGKKLNISSNSADKFYLSADGDYKLVESFDIKDAQIALSVSFLVTADNVSLLSRGLVPSAPGAGDINATNVGIKMANPDY
jgi:hypothetical protein